MDISGPNSREEEQTEVGQVVARHKEQARHIGTSLQHSINRVESNAGPGSQSFRLFVVVMLHVNVLVHPLISMQSAVHPINADFHATKVQDQIREVRSESTNLVNGVVHLGPTRLDEELISHGQKDIHKETRLGKSNLMPNGF